MFWSGIMGFSRDDHPWVGPLPSQPNLYIAAGFTGHGMPNTWLSGKAVAVMLGAAPGQAEMEAVEAARSETGLPRSYLVTKERVEAALREEDVEAKEWAEMQRGAAVALMAEGKRQVKSWGLI